jgi:hypothetical protein
MNQEVFIIVGGEEYSIGKVSELLNANIRHISLNQVIRGLVEDITYDDSSSDYVVLSIEVR